MTPATARRLQGVAAGAGVALVQLWPALGAAWAGSSGSAGDLSELPILAVGALWAIALAVLAGRIMVRGLDRAPAEPAVGRLDPWAAYALGLGTYGLAITALTALLLVALLGDEDQSLRSREWLVLLVWSAGHVLAAVAAYRAAATVLPAGVLSRRPPSPAD